MGGQERGRDGRITLVINRTTSRLSEEKTVALKNKYVANSMTASYCLGLRFGGV